MGIASDSTSNLGGTFLRIHPGDTALLREDEPAMLAALARYHETSDLEVLRPFLSASEKPTVFRLRHLPPRASAELESRLRETLSPSGEGTERSAIFMAHLCIADVHDWNGVDADGRTKQLKWRPHRDYQFKVLTDASYDDICAVAGGELAQWLGKEAWDARQLRPL